jgi:hypothetical protein
LTAPVCALRHSTPKRALSYALVCASHDRSIREDLVDIGLLYALLDDVSEPGSVVMDDLVRYAKRPDPPAPVRLEVATLRDTRTTWDVTDPDSLSVLATLAGWADIVRDELRLSAPGRATVTRELEVLVTQHDLVITQAWVDEYAKDIHRAAAALRHACGEFERTPSVGSCPVPPTPAQILDAAVHHQPEPGPCGGPLFPDRYGLMRVRCARCGEVWDEDDLRRLGLVLRSSR